MNYQRRQAIPLFTCFTIRSGPLHFINPQTGYALCLVNGPHSAINNAHIKRYHQPRKRDTICINCQTHLNNLKLSQSLPDIPDFLSLGYTEYHQLLSEYQTMSSAFDPASFLDSTISEPSTRRPPLPPSDFIATISKLESQSWTGKQDASKSGVMFKLQLKVQVTDPVLQAAQGGSEVTLFDTIMLDTVQGPPGSPPMIDNSPGKNNKLRRYREALNMNEAGVPFSPRQMEGRTLRVRIKHETYEGDLQDKIDSVMKV